MASTLTNPSHNTILIVDDTPANLKLLAKLLSQPGYKVRSAPNGIRALASARKAPPDIILLDIMMPEMDGFEVCRQLKENPLTQDIPVIFISALDQVFDKVTAFSVGGVDYITKPFQEEEVLARIHTHLLLHNTRQQLQAKNEQLSQQNKELDAFAHTVAHDLKNPLSSIMGYADMLIHYGDDMKAKDLEISLHSTHKAAQKAINIINSLLLLASVRKGQVQFEPLDMKIIMKQVEYRLNSMVRDFEGKVIMPETWPLALGYAPWVEEVWVNYMSNALKYGGRPPRVEVGSALDENNMVRFWVKDNGPGVLPEDQAKLFTEFTRIGEVKVDGHGLGLSIVQRIMNKLNGKAGVESAGIAGEGCTFYFTLPASA